jgi:hypothetical protein
VVQHGVDFALIEARRGGQGSTTTFTAVKCRAEFESNAAFKWKWEACRRCRAACFWDEGVDFEPGLSYPRILVLTPVAGS